MSDRTGGAAADAQDEILAAACNALDKAHILLSFVVRYGGKCCTPRFVQHCKNWVDGEYDPGARHSKTLQTQLGQDGTDHGYVLHPLRSSPQCGRAVSGKMRVHATYPWNGNFHMDDAARHAAGRPTSYSGCGMGERDLGWTNLSEIEAERIARALRKIGLTAEVKSDQQ